MNAAPVLSQPVLCLNRNWYPVRVTTVQDAIGLVAKGSAVIIETSDESYVSHTLITWMDFSKAKVKFGDAVIRSARMALLVPEVIVLTSYDGVGERGVVFSRRNLFKRDKYTCQYCGTQPNHDELTIDHVMPKSRGGLSSFDNCVLACIECNKRKANRTPDEAKMKLRKFPKKPTWKVLAQIPLHTKRQSWSKFVDEAYWNVELDP